MPFKSMKSKVAAPDTPLGLIPLLTRRTIPDVLPHQKEVLDAYVTYAGQKDVAMQLPTGSGKTLVGLLAAEWRRRKWDERVVYLCPTRQLVHQTVQQASHLYGIGAVGFTGSRRGYNQADWTAYRTGDKVAVTTYSSLFNTRPAFEDPDTIVFDDAHAAENYVASMWSIEIQASETETRPLHQALTTLLREHISSLSYSRLTGAWESAADATWVDKLPNSLVNEIQSGFVTVLDTHAEVSNDMRYVWPFLRDHLSACQVYLASRSILIRPLIPPTWTHAPFAGAKHRLYMSATLGSGGDLERLTGRTSITRMAPPKGFEATGVGRRLFLFPGLSLSDKKCAKLRRDMRAQAGRAVVLTPDADSAEKIAKEFEAENIPVFSASDIEASKDIFTKKTDAVAVMAGRFDGIDFPGDECRLLCLDGLPSATNAQERFLMSRMGASILLEERIQTRVLQAAGRCTRAQQDRSAVLVMGRELEDRLADSRKWSHFHPELQAELAFGVEQSKDIDADTFVNLFNAFLANDKDWDEANREIVEAARERTHVPFPGMDDLKQAVSYEIEFQMAMWNNDPRKALEAGRKVIACLKAPELRGYRALWHYLAGSAAHVASKGPDDPLNGVAREQFTHAKGAAPQLTWLSKLIPEIDDRTIPDNAVDEESRVQVERLEAVLTGFGTASDHHFERRVGDILTALNAPATFEEGQRLLGEFLGFMAGNSDADAAPDPWWLGSGLGVVFEDHADGKETTVFGAAKARQAAGHPNWVRENVDGAADLELHAVLVTPCRRAGKGARPQLGSVRYWTPAEFVDWVREAVATVRVLKASLPGPADLAWRADAASTLIQNGLTMPAIIEKLPHAVDIFEFE